MRLLSIADPHCGHLAGLTHPDWWINPRRGKSEWNKFAAIQREVWTWWEETIKEIGKIDVTLILGDCIDGDGKRSGGTELITTDRIEQAEMARRALEITKAKRYQMVYGTAYHTGKQEDYESLVAEALDATIGSHEWLDADGYIFDLKHHIGNSSVPYGQWTQLGKEMVHNTLWAAKGEQPAADVILRGHIHKYCACERRLGKRVVTAMSLPALQGYGSKYGARICSQTIDIGCVVWEIDRNGISYYPILPDFKYFKTKAN